jgi:dTDP-4-dehydrorhamnose reductase
MAQSPRIWIFGAQGQVGRAWRALFQPNSVFAPSRTQLDLSKPESFEQRLDTFGEKPMAVINAAAYTKVDQAESEESLALAINAQAVGALGRWCARGGIPLVHYSTDYVFSGEGEKPWREDAPTAPLSAYGRTKLEGERALAASGAKYLIIRTSWVYDEAGKNFLRTMLSLGATRNELNVVADQIGAPTYASDLARASLQMLDVALKAPLFPSGVYHVTNSGETSWHGFAEAIFDEARRRGILLKVRTLAAISTEQYPTPAERPRNSRLDQTKVLQTFGIRMRPWREALAECMNKIKL